MGPLLTVIVLVLLAISIASGMYALAEGTGKRKSVSWAACVVSALLLAAILLLVYLGFILKELPAMG